MKYVSNISTEDEFDLISKLVRIYSVVEVPESMHLTNAELQFFTHCVLLFNSGVDISSTKAVKELEKRTGYNKKNRGVYLYRNRLKNRGWLYQTPDGLKIPDQFVKPGGFKQINYDIRIERNDITTKN